MFATPLRRSLSEWRDRGVSVFLLTDDWQAAPERDMRTRLERERFQARLVPLRRFLGLEKGFQGPGLAAYRLAPQGP